MRLIGLLAAVALLLAGCGTGDPVPKVPKPSASAAPTATLPTMPTAAQKDSKAGAIAFVKHYIEVFNYASNTGNVEELKRLSDPKCEGCNSYIQLIVDTYLAGGYFKDAGWAVESARIDSASSHWGILLKIDAPPSIYAKDSSTPPINAPSDKYNLYLRVRDLKQVELMTEPEVS